MRLVSHSRIRGAGVSGAALAVALAWTPVAMAQDAPAAAPAAQQTPETSDEGEIVVQGFRASLNSALHVVHGERNAERRHAR